MKSIFLLLSILVCAPAGADVKYPGTFTYLGIQEPNSLDPAWANDSASNNVILNVYETLFAYEGSSAQKLIPLLAEKVPSRANGLISADGKTYRIPIRKGVLFQDGTPMTPDDVRYSILRFMLYDRDAGPSAFLLEPLLGYASTRDAKGTLRAGAFADAAKAVRIEGGNLVLHLSKPFAPLLTILASWSPVLSKKWATENGGWDGGEATWAKFNNPAKESSRFFEHANGTGPFKLDRWDRRVQELVLVRNDRYWRKPAKLDRVVIRTIKEFATRKLMLEAGDADAVFAERAVLGQLRGVAGTKIIDDLPTIGVDPVVAFSFHLNPVANPYIGSGRLDGDGVPPEFFADKDIRTAFAYSFDYAGFIRDVQQGKGAQASGCIPSSLAGHNPKQKMFKLDPEKAKEHFRKAFGGKVWETGFRFTLAYNSGNTDRGTICQIIKRSVEELNPKFRIDVRAAEWPTYIDALRAAKLPMFLTGFGPDYPDPHDFAFILMRSGNGLPKIQNYNNAEADKLVDAAARETDAGRRKALYSRLQEIEYEDVPHLVILEPVVFRVQRDWVRGWVYNPVFPMSTAGNFYPVYKSQ